MVPSLTMKSQSKLERSQEPPPGLGEKQAASGTVLMRAVKVAMVVEGTVIVGGDDADGNDGSVHGNGGSHNDAATDEDTLVVVAMVVVVVVMLIIR